MSVFTTAEKTGSRSCSAWPILLTDSATGARNSSCASRASSSKKYRTAAADSIDFSYALADTCEADARLIVTAEKHHEDGTWKRAAIEQRYKIQRVTGEAWVLWNTAAKRVMRPSTTSS